DSAALAPVREVLEGSREVRRVLGPDDPGGRQLRSDDGKRAAFLVGLKATTSRDAERAVPAVRAALAPIRDQGMKLALTGRGPMVVDMNILSERDTAVAEGRVLPLTLLILLIAFGSLVAAGLPLLLGVASTILTLGIVYFIGQVTPLSTLVQTVTTMVGLGIGIDYSLILVKRFRETGSLREAMAGGGPAIAWSGVTVLIGFGSLLFTPLLETRSLGVGGIVVVLVSLAAGLTLLPALLAVLGSRVDAGSWLSRPAAKEKAARAWDAWARRIMANPVPALIAGTAILLAMGFPALSMKQGFPSGKWLPIEMESVQGFEALEKMGHGQLHAPIDVVVRSTGGPVLSTVHLADLKALGDKLSADPRVRHVRSPLHLVEGMSLAQAYLLYADLDKAIARYPAIAEFFLSRDRTAALFTVIPSDAASLGDIQALTREVATWTPGKGLTQSVGGFGAYYNDFDDAMAWTYPRVFAFVIVATFLVLFAAFRSLLVPIKAIAMNLLSVGAGYGVVVLMFQHGAGAGLVGLDRPLGAIPAVVPILLFCLLFGLSMDYEVFLLTRIREIFDATGDNREAVARGLAVTGGMITSAALIMAIVFGAFAFAQLAIVKMLGVGLAVAVLVDATVIRALLVPALMRLAGDRNWYPGAKGALVAAVPEA
ncbi:MAG: MMPL family transporter, partial [Candidatus Sericytochromatia bacterium]|nr:MMPL family transporter [Candidatus Tanganyikabacteria bacterium]